MNPYKILVDLLAAFPDEATCIKHLEHTRWPKASFVPVVVPVVKPATLSATTSQVR
ncbi:MAG: hypothetical protein OXC41_01730 [Gammaproteobacteria bacterium]|nr:hypothetical protein [Gammaproteobacteria bacterium]